MMDLLGLQAFVAVAETGSFSAAAAALGLAKSTVSQRVQALEQGLGVSLLHRTTRRLRLTEHGEALFERGKPVMDAVVEAEWAMSVDPNEVVGEVRFAAPVALGRRLLPDVLPQLLEAHPRLSIRVDLHDAVVDLVSGGYDLALRVGALKDAGLVVRRVGETRMLLVGAPAYLARSGPVRTPHDLADHECLRYGHQRLPSTWHFREDGAVRQVRVSGRLMADDGELLADMAAQGVGLAWLPDFIAMPLVRSGQLQILLDDACDDRLPIQVVLPDRRFVPRKSRVIIDALAAALSGTPSIPSTPGTATPT